MDTPNKPQTVIVHKEGDEGTLQLDRMTGRIVTPLDQRPDWAEGLTTALVQERITFYEKRLGGESEAFKQLASAATAIEFSDLGWLGVNAEGNELEIDADPSYRSEVVAKALGIDTDEGTMSGNVIAERDVSRENRGRSPEEMAALDEAMHTGFTGGTRADAENERDRQQAARR